MALTPDTNLTRQMILFSIFILPIYVINFSVETTSKFKLNVVFPFSPLSLKTFNQGIKWYISEFPYLHP